MPPHLPKALWVQQASVLIFVTSVPGRPWRCFVSVVEILRTLNLPNNRDTMGIIKTGFHVAGTDWETLHNLARVLAARKWWTRDLKLHRSATKAYICCYAAHSAVSLFVEIEFTVSNLLSISLNCWKPISDTEVKICFFLFLYKIALWELSRMSTFFSPPDNHFQILETLKCSWGWIHNGGPEEEP